MKKIALTQNKFTVVDDIDYQSVSRFKWYFSNGYAVRTSYGQKVLLHRQVMDALHLSGRKYVVDHISGDTLDNRRQNLRVCGHSGNNSNTVLLRKNNKSGYRGVSFQKRHGKWHAHIQFNKKQKSLGAFSTKEEAALAYNDAAIKYHKEFAKLNKIVKL